MRCGQPLFGQHVSSPRIKRTRENSAVQERRASSSKVDNAISNQDASVNGPGRLDSVEGANQTLFRRTAKAPDKLAVGQTHVIHTTVRAAEECLTLINRRWRIHSAVCSEPPFWLSVADIKGQNFMRIDIGQHDGIANHNATGRLPPDVRFPRLLQIGLQRRRRSPTSLSIVAIHGPVMGILDCRFSIADLAIHRAFHQSF